MVQISTTKPRLLMDEAPDIKITGLEPMQKVTLTAHMYEGKQGFVAFAHYIADDQGMVSNMTSRSVGGTFTGIEPAGLFWSMAAVGSVDYSIRLRIHDVTVPYDTKICVIDRHIPKPEGVPDVTSALCVLSIERTYLSNHVIRQPIRIGRIRGTLFIPNEGKGQSPGIVDLFGTAGGLMEHRAAILASRGFCALALAFFQYDDLSPTISPLDLTYFEEAVNFLDSHKNTTPNGIGILGLSKGADLAMYTAVISPKIKAVVAVAPFHANLHTELHYHKKVYPASMMNFADVTFGPNGEQNYRKAFLTTPNIEELRIPIEQSEAAFCFFHGTDDQMNDCVASVKLSQQLREHGRSNFEIYIYNGAGHLIEPPHTPLCILSYHKQFDVSMMLGGSVPQHAYAQDDHWRRLQSFFWNHLDPQHYSVTSHL